MNCNELHMNYHELSAIAAEMFVLKFPETDLGSLWVHYGSLFQVKATRTQQMSTQHTWHEIDLPKLCESLAFGAQKIGAFLSAL